jgi:L-amino acid N-acyltransferase YncA
VKIREATEADLPAIVAIYNRAIATRMSTAQLEPVTLEERLPWFHEHTPERHPLWVLELDAQVAGWLSFHAFITRCAYRGTVEVSVYVQENFRRRGVGQALLKKGIRRSPELGITALIGLIFGHNTASLDLFAKVDFVRWGFLPQVARIEENKRDLVIVGRHIVLPNAC